MNNQNYLRGLDGAILPPEIFSQFSHYSYPSNARTTSTNNVPQNTKSVTVLNTLPAGIQTAISNGNFHDKKYFHVED